MKFNILKRKKKNILNHEGAKAVAMTPEYELYSAVVTTGLSTAFYEKGDDRLERIRFLIGKCDHAFVAQLAIYARNNMYLRSIPLVLVVELAKYTTGNSLVSQAIEGVVKRADEITELLAYYQLSNERTGAKKLNRLSKQVQKGLVRSFNRFDEYQFAKYNRSGEVKMKDALFLVHPKPKDEGQQAIFDKIANNNLETPYTWETELSGLGKQMFGSVEEKERAVRQKWEELIESKRLGYMAVMRNLRNILQAGVSGQHIKMVCDYLSNRNAVLGAKQMPFRFLSAYREVKLTPSKYAISVLQALENAALISAENIQGFEYDTSVVIACDVSGSMRQAISPKSKVMLYDVGLVLGMLLQSQCKNVVTGMFGNTWKRINMPSVNVLSNVMEFHRREGEVGYATNGYLVIDKLIRRNEVVDKVMIFTDLQLWNTKHSNRSFSKSWNEYKQIAPKAKLYLFDLAGYGQLPLDTRPNDVYLIAGWSDKVFDILNALDQSNSAIDLIKKIDL